MSGSRDLPDEFPRGPPVTSSRRTSSPVLRLRPQRSIDVQIDGPDVRPLRVALELLGKSVRFPGHRPAHPPCASPAALRVDVDGSRCPDSGSPARLQQTSWSASPPLAGRAAPSGSSQEQRELPGVVQTPLRPRRFESPRSWGMPLGRGAALISSLDADSGARPPRRLVPRGGARLRPATGSLDDPPRLVQRVGGTFAVPRHRSRPGTFPGTSRRRPEPSSSCPGPTHVLCAGQSRACRRVRTPGVRHDSWRRSCVSCCWSCSQSFLAPFHQPGGGFRVPCGLSSGCCGDRDYPTSIVSMGAIWPCGHPPPSNSILLVNSAMTRAFIGS